jgi:hypothetical protein
MQKHSTPPADHNTTPSTHVTGLGACQNCNRSQQTRAVHHTSLLRQQRVCSHQVRLQHLGSSNITQGYMAPGRGLVAQSVLATALLGKASQALSADGQLF